MRFHVSGCCQWRPVSEAPTYHENGDLASTTRDGFRALIGMDLSSLVHELMSLRFLIQFPMQSRLDRPDVLAHLCNP
jgi:hypothetical protein